MNKILTYDELLNLKKLGKGVSWDEVSGEQLSALYVDEDKSKGSIADLFDIKDTQVTYKRNKECIFLMDHVRVLLLDGAIAKLQKMLNEKLISRNTYYKLLFTYGNYVFSINNTGKNENSQITYQKIAEHYNDLLFEIQKDGDLNFQKYWENTKTI